MCEVTDFTISPEYSCKRGFKNEDHALLQQRVKTWGCVKCPPNPDRPQYLKCK